MQCQAAITSDRAGRPFECRTVTLDEPRDDEILVRVTGVGICHSDLTFHTMVASHGPHLLGHEGAGIVERTGKAVTSVAPGDKVVLSFRSCDDCPACRAGSPAYCRRFEELNIAFRRGDGSSPVTDSDGSSIGSCFFGQSSFADHAIAYEDNVVKVPDDVPVELLGPLGCGVQTGAGAVLRSLACTPASSLLVTGGGTVGLSAVLAAKLAGCTIIVVSEPSSVRRQMALELGASHVIDPAAGALADMALGISPDGFDYAIDTTARTDVLTGIADAMAARGVIGILGMFPDPAALCPIPINQIMAKGLSIRGVCEGDSDPQQFIPELIEHWRSGRFPFDRMIRTFRLDEINEAVEVLESGAAIKAVLLT
ncbi:MAG: NAD(P)-dependent alcohol dehydrogenase [Sphingomonadales bacterium]|nr:MAG: NAD(P)-dependent alcohol dehydrogenase [Sphingomonadales bacterium]